MLFVLAYLGGVLTIVSPCIVPVLPFVFGRAGRPFTRSGLPMLVGMTATFSVVATLAAVGGGWAVHANQYGRTAALVLLGCFGITLLFPSLSARLTQPLVSAGARLSQSADRREHTDPAFAPSFLLGVATGLLWAPCAGPVLGLILTGAALEGANARTSGLLLAYAAGAATSLGLAVLIGGRVFTAMKQSLGIGEWVRRGLGIAVLAAVCAIALGLDTGVLTRLSLARTSAIEQRLLDRFDAAPQPSSSVVMSDGATMSGGAAMTGGGTMASDARAGGDTAAGGGAMMMSAASAHGGPEVLGSEGTLPSLEGAVQWLNSPPLTTASLKGKVVVVDFWTYSCINCLRSIPFVKAWADKYKDQGLIVIGVHAPEFAFEKNVNDVKKAVLDMQIGYPVAIDNNYAIWRAFNNQYWPAHYFIDAKGQIRHHHFGEGDYDGSERVIQQLLTEIGATTASTGLVSVKAAGVEAAPDLTEVQSPETYVGYERAEHFVSPEKTVRDNRHVYTPGTPRLNEWGLAGDWSIGAEEARLNTPDGRIVYRFHARDLHLVLGPAADSRPVRFRVTIDGAAPGVSHGMDIDADGHGTVTGQRLYQLIRQSGPIVDHAFEIRFLDPGVQAYAFTFG